MDDVGGGGERFKPDQKFAQLTEQRLSESETRLAALEERVDFYERLLANPTSSSKSEPPKSTS